MPYHINKLFNSSAWYPHGFNPSKWIGREVEFRNNIPLQTLSYNHVPAIYKGRIIKIKDELAIVKITYSARLHVECKDILNKNYKQNSWWKGSHHKTISIIKRKHQFIEYKKEEYFLLKYIGTRWKSLGPIKIDGLYDSNWYRFLG